MASNYTRNYGLCQWEATDQVRREEFNQDNTKMDETLKTLADKDIALESAVAAVEAAAGNCQMELFTYTGTGSYGGNGPTKIRFNQIPDVFFVTGDLTLVTGRGGDSSPLLIAKDTSANGSFVSTANASWSGSEASFTNGVDARYQLNSANKPYWVLGLKQKK